MKFKKHSGANPQIGLHAFCIIALMIVIFVFRDTIIEKANTATQQIVQQQEQSVSENN